MNNKAIRGSVTASGRKRSGPSIADVAHSAGVSAQTVSRVATGSDLVRPATREKVLAAMDELGYSPNYAARALRNGSFGTIGVIAHRLGRTGESHTVEAVVEAARQQSLTTSLVDIETPSSEGITEAAQRLNNQAIDGLIIIRAESATPNSLALPAKLPVVVSDSRFVGHHPSVGADQATGTTGAIRHLLELGHLTVHHLAGPIDSDPAIVRAETWEGELRKAKRIVPKPYQGDWSAESGYREGLKIAEEPNVTAVFCANDEMAAGLMRALYERGLSIPGDVSVIGFDDIPIAPYLSPPLTTVRQDFSKIGFELVDLLVRQIQHQEKLSEKPVLVPAPLIVRASTGEPSSKERF